MIGSLTQTSRTCVESKLVLIESQIVAFPSRLHLLGLLRVIRVIRMIKGSIRVISVIRLLGLLGSLE